MIRPAVTADAPALGAFLARHPNSSMFLRSNLATAGIGNLDHPHGTFFLVQIKQGEIIGTFGVTNEGYAMCQAPEAGPAEWQAFARGVAGRGISGITGSDTQVLQAIDALALPADLFSLNHAEPLYRLELAQLDPPQATLRAPETLDIDLLMQWFLAYMQDTGLGGGPDMASKAIERAVNAIKGDVTRLLIVDGRPVAMTAFNARFEDMVQIGGVYTPPERRSRGYGRQVVAAHLAEARKDGVKTAILFSNNDAASKAYESIGFQRVGSYRVAVLKEPVTIGS
ncbi:MAG: GNAT family N-acetyltransferase [Pseudomonadota bacterium]|nr:GNAT family N-acetyltransferase [Pseudomonadota bacterium]